MTAGTPAAPRVSTAGAVTAPGAERRGAAAAPFAPVGSGAVLVWALACIVAVTFAYLFHWGLYLNGDGGHYLADASALSGHGVRALGHLPIFPGLLLVIHMVVRNSLVALDVAMGLVMVALSGAFYLFVRGRLGNRWAEVAGTILFALSPLFAEGVAWYGASMLLGLALSLVAMRCIDTALSAPRIRTTVLAGAVSGAVALTHPFSLLFLFEAAVLAVGMRVVAAVVIARSAAFAPRAVAPRIAAGAAIAVCVAVAVFAGRSFYTSAQNPVSISIDFSRLHLLFSWALRDDTPLWLALFGAVLVVLPAGWWLARERGLHLSIWVTAVAAVSLANVVLMTGAGDYVTRNFYALPIVLGVTFAMLVAVAVKATSILAARRPVLRRVVVAVPVLVALAAAAQAYAGHLAVAVPYYNMVTGDEYAAITWLHGQHGTVVVTDKDTNIDDGTLYAWMIEGLDNVRAIGPGSDTVNLLAAERAESSAAVRIIDGDISAARTQNVRYVFTWRSTGLVSDLAARLCYQVAYTNSEIVIFSVAPWRC